VDLVRGLVYVVMIGIGKGDEEGEARMVKCFNS